MITNANFKTITANEETKFKFISFYEEIPDKRPGAYEEQFVSKEQQQETEDVFGILDPVINTALVMLIVTKHNHEDKKLYQIRVPFDTEEEARKFIKATDEKKYDYNSGKAIELKIKVIYAKLKQKKSRSKTLMTLCKLLSSGFLFL